MEEETKVSKKYKEGYNWGYLVSSELGLKPNAIEGISAGGDYMQGMKDGMIQHGKELIEKQKETKKDIIPPLDLDNIENRHIDLEIPEKDKDRGMDMDS